MKKQQLLHYTVLFLFMYSLGGTKQLIAQGAPAILHVNIAQTDDSGDGLSWATAKKTLQGALDIAIPGDEIWVAAGTYYPVQTHDGSTVADSATSFTFSLIDGIQIYGGFDGTEMNFADRDFTINFSILSGNLGSATSYADNCMHIVYARDCGQTTRLDGFIFAYGYANVQDTLQASGQEIYGTSGAGVYLDNSEMVVANSLFTNNIGIFGASVFCNASSTLEIESCNFYDNVSLFGGGIFNRGSLSCYASEFGNNTAQYSGGGIYSENANPVVVEDCLFDANVVTDYGGGIYNLSTDLEVNNCIFDNHSVASGGGGVANISGNLTISNSQMRKDTVGVKTGHFVFVYFGAGIYNRNGLITVDSCVFDSCYAIQGAGIYSEGTSSNLDLRASSFTYNHASNKGGAVALSDAPGTLDSCIFEFNSSDEGGGTLFFNGNTQIISNCDFNHNATYGFGTGGVAELVQGATTFEHCNFNDNEAISTLGGAIRADFFHDLIIENSSFDNNNSFQGGSVAAVFCDVQIENTTFKNDSAVYGGAVFAALGDQLIQNCIFENNYAKGSGGALYFDQSDGADVINCIGQGNAADTAASFLYSIETITNIIATTLHENDATSGNSSLLFFDASNDVNIHNCIIWDNESTNIDFLNSTVTVTHSIVQDGYAGTGNLDVSPLFANKLMPKGADSIWRTTDDGLILSTCSPAIDAGNNTANPSTNTEDALFADRIVFGTVDMGAYESTSASTDAVIAGMTTSNEEVQSSLTSYVDENCNLIATVEQTGASPIQGSVSAKVWLDATSTADHVLRHYEIHPAQDAATATATVTLYFEQSEFDAFNGLIDASFPTGPADATGISKIRVTKRAGVSSDGSGDESSYPGAEEVINPDDAACVWNATANRWEISFDVVGFSGFWLKTEGILPIESVVLNAKLIENNTKLNWTIDDLSTLDYCVLEHAQEDLDFVELKRFNKQQFEHMHLDVKEGLHYYRILAVEKNGQGHYSNIVSVNNQSESKLAVRPTVFRDAIYLHGIDSKNYQLMITNGQGQLIFEQNIIGQDAMQIATDTWSTGSYYIQLIDEQKLVHQFKLFKMF